MVLSENDIKLKGPAKFVIKSGWSEGSSCRSIVADFDRVTCVAPVHIIKSQLLIKRFPEPLVVKIANAFLKAPISKAVWFTVEQATTNKKKLFVKV